MLSKEYKHISHLLLYPLLNIPYNRKVQPIATYMGWKGKYSIKDCKLFVVYKKSDLEYQLKFRKMHLESNECYIGKKSFKSQMIYIYDLETIHHSNCKNIQKGKYSLISPDIKYRLTNYYSRIRNPIIDIDKILYPKDYHYDIANELNVHVDIVKEVNESLSRPIIGKEILDTSKWVERKNNLYLHKQKNQQ